MNAINVEIARFDPETHDEKYVDTFEDIEYSPKNTILDILLKIKDTMDPSLAFRFSCACTICGSCAVRVNGQAKLACETKIVDVQEKGLLKIEPLQNFEVIKDLIVDIEPIIEKLKKIMPWLIRDHKEPMPEREFIIKPDEFSPTQEVLDRCTLCGVCYSDCEMECEDHSFIGMISLVKSLKFILDPRDAIAGARLQQLVEMGLLKHPEECGALCPKGVDFSRHVLGPLRTRAEEAGLK
jgi:succinate dehydrogenase/fumarate reductase iron-sulfur protein